MLRIDAHQHFWKFNAARDSWITEDMGEIRKDFLPADLKPLLNASNLDGCVAIEADQSEEQNEFLIGLAEEHSFIKGIVGWVDLRSERLEERLEYYKQYDIIKGFRHGLQSEKDRAFMLQPAFMKGIAKLARYRFTYDVLVQADQLQYIPEFVSKFPDQRFVIDHLAKPDIKGKAIKDWSKEMMAVAKYENVYCKVSGMVTEADWKNWRNEDFTAYLDVVFHAFGADRTMYGSDWPVCLVAASYLEAFDVVAEYTTSFTQDEKNKFFGGNAINFYSLAS